MGQSQFIYKIFLSQSHLLCSCISGSGGGDGDDDDDYTDDDERHNDGDDDDVLRICKEWCRRWADGHTGHLQTGPC